jgi:predicted metal-binding membrane protein
LNDGAAPVKPDAPLLALLRGLSRAEMLSAGAILLVTLIAWGYIVTLPPTAPPSASMSDMPAMNMGDMSANDVASWTWARALATFAMWSVMMAAMMLPAAAPIVLLHRRTAMQAHALEAPAPSTALLVLGYAAAWSGFAALATASQWALSNAALLTEMDAFADRRMAGAVLIAAGLYQLTPFKQACLQLCRSPVAFLMRHYQPGAVGALRMGLRHGLYCLGCCWAAMALLFVGGVMNLIWVAGLAAFVLIEKALPFGRVFGIAIGIGAFAVGGYWLMAGVV